MKLEGRTIKELEAMIMAIHNDPKNKGEDGSIFLLSKSAMKKTEDIAREIAHKIRQGKIERGEYVNDAGYSGRKSNRR